MLKSVRDPRILEGLATLAATIHGKGLIKVLEDELEAVKEALVTNSKEELERLQGRARALSSILELLKTAAAVTSRLKQR